MSVIERETSETRVRLEVVRGEGRSIISTGLQFLDHMMTTLARYSREHNGANVLALGATLLRPAEAKELVDVFLSTPTLEPRYLRRLMKIRRLEESF